MAAGGRGAKFFANYQRKKYLNGYNGSGSRGKRIDIKKSWMPEVFDTVPLILLSYPLSAHATAGP
jgi:hypothetical protein